jgi:sugar phosphate isomerase/epimerase
MTQISVSAYSLREQLGPISIPFTDPNGQEQVFAQDFPSVIRITDFPEQAADRFPVAGVEAVAFQFRDVDDPALGEFVERATAAGLALVNVAVDTGDLLSTDDERRGADVAELKRWIDRLAQLGFAFVRVNPGSPFSAHHGDTPPSHLVAALRELGAHANARGIRLLVENHGGPSSDPVWMNALLDAVGHDHLGLLLDLGNFDALMGPLMAAMFAEPGSAPVDPFADLDLTSLYAGIEALAGRAELVHVKAHLADESGAVGPVDLPHALDILDRHGYDGWLTIEYEGTGGDPWAKTGSVVAATTAVASVR